MRLFLERHFEIIDQAVVLSLALVVFVLGNVVDHDAFVVVLLGGNRIAVYAVIVGLFGTIFGFALTAMSIVLAFAESPRLRTLRESRHWATLWRVFTRGIRTFLLVALVGLVAIIVDREKAPAPLVPYVVALVVMLGVARIYRVLWAFENLIHVMIRPDQISAGSEAEDHELVGSR